MLKKHREFYFNLLFIQDIFVIAISWLFSFNVRSNEYIIPIDPVKGPPILKYYLILLIFIVILWRIVFKYFKLYSIKSTHSLLKEIFNIVKASTVAIILLTTLTYFFRQYEFSRAIFLYFWFISIIALSISRITTRKIILFYRRKSGNQRHVLIVGADKLAQEVALRIKRHPDLGLEVVGFLANGNQSSSNDIDQSKIIGCYNNIRESIKSYDVELVIIALSLDEHSKVKSVLKLVEGETVDIKLVPDFFQFITLRGETEEFDGLTFINVQSSPLYGWNVVNKRIFDIFIASISIILSFPLMILIALAIKVTSRGPLIYKQERMGLDGKVFEMYKFRSMKVNSEVETGPVWATKEDPRKTSIGKMLRTTSIDELPQLFNVIKGEMSLVGPRPERTVFIDNFKKKLPKYMLRHKVKAGMTGWAQVNGWRGDTSVEKRIEYDLYYIENWSIGFDIKIVLQTLLKGFINKNAY